MTWEEWVRLLQQTYPSEGGTIPNIWSYSRAMRERESDPQLANAEHYLYGRKMVEDDPWNALYGYLNKKEQNMQRYILRQLHTYLWQHVLFPLISSLSEVLLQTLM